MKRTNEVGSLNVLLIPFILLVLFFGGAVGFAVWAFNGRQDYKNHSDQKAAVAVDAAVKAEDIKKDAQFAQDEKNPLKIYQGSETYGNIHLSYPKTWSGYVNTANSSTPIDGYFSPGVVPSVDDQNSVFSLRLQVVSQSYSSVMQSFTSSIQTNKVTVTPYSLPQVKGVVGSRVDGAVALNKQGSMIVLPVRDKTLKIWTESTSFTGDLNTIILPNVTFSP